MMGSIRFVKIKRRQIVLIGAAAAKKVHNVVVGTIYLQRGDIKRLGRGAIVL